MSYTTTHYDIAHLIDVEVTRYPGTRSKRIELIIAGEARQSTPSELLSMLKVLEQIKKDLKLK